MFICMPKPNFIIYFFLEILHFKEFCYLIGWQHFGLYLKNQNFARYGIGGEISTAILLSILDYFQEKLMIKFFKKSEKPYFGTILGTFCQHFGKNDFSWKKWLCQFLDFSMICHFNYFHFREKRRTNGRTDGRTDRQTMVIL